MTTTPSKKEEQREATEAEQRRQRDYLDTMAKQEETREATEAELRTQRDYLDTMAEVDGMSRAYAALHKLPADAQDRAMRWLDARLNAERVHVHIDPYKDEEPPF